MTNLLNSDWSSSGVIEKWLTNQINAFFFKFFQLTFLEFCQVIILCTEFALKKEAMEQIRSEIISRYKADLQEYEKKLQEYEKQKGNTTKKGSSSFTSKKGRK